MTPTLIVMSGLPGAGKSSIGEALATRIGAPIFAKDWLEAALLRSEAVEREKLSRAGYALLSTLARRQLSLGQSAILDSVAGLAAIREEWRELAREFDAAWFAIECVCSDAGLHRSRLEGRKRGIPGWHELEWSDVERSRAYYEPWSGERLVLDSADPLEGNIARALEYVRPVAD